MAYAILKLHIALVALAVASATNEIHTCVTEMTPRVAIGHVFEEDRLGIRETARLINPNHMFETSFDVTPVVDQPVFPWVRQHLFAWLKELKIARGDVLGRIRQMLEEPRGEVTTMMADPLILRLVLAEPQVKEGRRSLAIFLEHPKELMWRTEIAIDERPDKGVHVTASVLTWRPDARRHFNQAASVPRVIRAIMEDSRGRAASGRLPITAHPVIIDEKNVEDFLLTVNDPTRLLPIVYVSRPTNGGHPPFNADDLSMRLRGFATVMVEADVPFLPVTRVLRAALPKTFVENGAVRVIGTDGRDLGRYEVNGPGNIDAVSKRLIREVIARSTRHVRAERAGWTNSIYDLIP